MLSVDMKKEGLCGRTLTLKLKTASFEVRTRAVTLQKHICSSEDILKNALKLLKAELPISLRIIGLWMSQFNEDKDITPSDPTQKTLSDFIQSGDAAGRNMDDHMSFGSDLSDDHFTTESITGLPIDNPEIYHNDVRDPLDSSRTPDAKNSNCILSNNNGEMDKSNALMNDESKAMGNKFEMVEHALKSYEAEASQLVKRDSFDLSAQFEGSNLDTVNKRTNLSEDEAVSSSNQKEQYLWLDDYKCLICGVELPPSFVEERQEHSDFHLAERLQKEESNSNPRNHPLKQSPKRSRRDGKPTTERPSSNLNLDVGHHSDRDQKHRRRLQYALPLEAPPAPDSKVETGAGSKEFGKRTNGQHDGNKKSANPTEVPRSRSYFQVL